jgi:hypothetical protein
MRPENDLNEKSKHVVDVILINEFYVTVYVCFSFGFIYRLSSSSFDD